jgi:uncharacterized membrane-anchored protein YitT (DUF2179 family)
LRFILWIAGFNVAIVVFSALLFLGLYTAILASGIAIFSMAFVTWKNSRGYVPDGIAVSSKRQRKAIAEYVEREVKRRKCGRSE